MQVKVPPTFYRDHIRRDLPGGSVIKQTRTYIEVQLTIAELAELFSDADHYANSGQHLDREMNGLVQSAKATVAKLRQFVATHNPPALCPGCAFVVEPSGTTRNRCPMCGKDYHLIRVLQLAGLGVTA
jgi:tRNA(Ile2) C34 agmatinyltransferase TiaS